MRGRTEHQGRIMRTVYCRETGTFTHEEETHPFLLRLAESHLINGTAIPVQLPIKPNDCPDKGVLK